MRTKDNTDICEFSSLRFFLKKSMHACVLSCFSLCLTSFWLRLGFGPRARSRVNALDVGAQAGEPVSPSPHYPT